MLIRMVWARFCGMNQEQRNVAILTCPMLVLADSVRQSQWSGHQLCPEHMALAHLQPHRGWSLLWHQGRWGLWSHNWYQICCMTHKPAETDKHIKFLYVKWQLEMGISYTKIHTSCWFRVLHVALHQSDCLLTLKSLQSARNCMHNVIACPMALTARCSGGTVVGPHWRRTQSPAHWKLGTALGRKNPPLAHCLNGVTHAHPN